MAASKLLQKHMFFRSRGLQLQAYHDTKHFRQTVALSAWIHLLARKNEHLHINQIQMLAVLVTVSRKWMPIFS